MPVILAAVRCRSNGRAAELAGGARQRAVAVPRRPRRAI